MLSDLLPIVDSVHLDIMDGQFVPPEAHSVEFIESFNPGVPKHIHVMAYDPASYLDHLSTIDSFSFHIEALEDPIPLLERISLQSLSPGLVLNPETPVSRIEPYLGLIERVILMAVKPGFSGQKYLPDTSRKLIDLRKLAPDLPIVIDGGMHEDTIREVMTLGASSCVVCSVIVKASDPPQKARELRESGLEGSDNREALFNE